jgi:phosphate transport system substrate-binding protein
MRVARPSHDSANLLLMDAAVTAGALATAFGKYMLVATLGRGGMADVYLAVARGPAGFHKLVVIKRLRSDVAERALLESMLLDEASLAARLRHPNVVQTLEVGVHEGQGFIAMEYLDGQPLHVIAAAARMARRPLDAPFALAVVGELLSGLHYAHELTDYDGRPLGIVHRDVSPQNVFLTYDGEVKLVDFGVAKARLPRPMETEVGVLKGKLGYMAPEQVRDGRVDRRADVFAAGIVLWELLTQRRLFRASTAGATLQKVLDGASAPPSRYSPVDPLIDAVVMRALAPEPSARYGTANEMRLALDDSADRLKLRPPRREERGAAVCELFAEERRKVQERIRECMAESNERGESAPLETLPRISVAVLDEAAGTPRSQTPPATQVVPPPPAPRPRWALWMLGAASLLAVAGGIAWLGRRARVSPEARQPETPVASASAIGGGASTDTKRYALRLHGSNTVGTELAPLLVEAFYRQGGASNVVRRKGARPTATLVESTATGGDESARVEILAEGTATGFDGLAKGECDIAMASRPINDDEATRLAGLGLGDMRAPASEHVVALDGIAVVVHPNNPVRSLDESVLASLFSGETRDWSKAGGSEGPVHVYARDDASGTYDLFKHLVLGDKPLAPDAQRFADSTQLADAVARDVGGVGFVGLAYVRSAKAVAVGEPGVPSMYPSSFTVTTEGYPLSRRLYLYTASRPSDVALSFINFALSAAGQRVVREAGFVDLDVSLQPAQPCDWRCPPRYAELTKRARRLSLDFRFQTGTKELDARARRDLDRLLVFLREHPGGGLALLGFSDASGSPADNVKLSTDRARSVEAELAARGVHASAVEGFGAQMPVSSNADDEGRRRNRRVEVWLQE